MIFNNGFVATLALSATLFAQVQPANSSASPQPIPSENEGKIYQVGGDVKPPAPTSTPEPRQSADDQERAGPTHSATVVLGVVVGSDGSVTKVKLKKGIGLGLDEKAIEVVKTWKFLPARRNGVPVPVEIVVKIDFKLYGRPK